ncbi:MAG: hypothetical protein ACRELA_21085 [Candidatus Rokuibacteriota bacterium]
MNRRVRVFLVLLVAAVGTGACATPEQWVEWNGHSSHFASGDHLFFSLRHQGTNPVPRVTRTNLERARTENWWGDLIVVRPDQLFEG